jgi:DNA-binding GntR family transcriptional regulator
MSPTRAVNAPAQEGPVGPLDAGHHLTEPIRVIRRLDFINPERVDAAFDEHTEILNMLLARKAARAQVLINNHFSA